VPAENPAGIFVAVAAVRDRRAIMIQIYKIKKLP
jgi:hypothetical protein